MEEKAKTETPPNQAVNELTQFLAPLAEGTLVPDYVNKLHEVVQAVTDTKSGGEIVFQVKILNLRETILKNFREVCDKIAEDTGLPIHYTK